MFASFAGVRKGEAMIGITLGIIWAAAASVLFAPLASAGPLPLDRIELPPGFEISVFAENVGGARAMVFSPSGTLFVGSKRGEVYALVDKDRDWKADRVITVARNLSMPVGVDFRDGSLWVSAVSRILRFDRIESRLENPPVPAVFKGFPTDFAHGWKFIRFGPDGRLYVPVGAPCNSCRKDDRRYATIMRMNQDGSGIEVYAHGVRNTVGFDWHPRTKELWFTDNGRDLMGDNIPPDELNHAPVQGLHFGFPYCHGGDIPDPEYGKERPCSDFVPPAMKLGPHVAALGMRFYTGEMFPEEYRNQIFIAEHGSWNRSSKIGYRVTLVRLRGNVPTAYEVFAGGWLQGEEHWGRPVDVEIAPDGSLFVSDDYANAIYRISYTASRRK